MKCIGPFFHAWSKWRDFDVLAGECRAPWDREYHAVGDQYVQVRECADCGKKEYKKTEVDW